MAVKCRGCGNSFPVTEDFWYRYGTRLKFNTYRCKLCFATTNDERRRLLDKAFRNMFIKGAVNDDQ